jgi:hypothetical protein
MPFAHIIALQPDRTVSKDSPRNDDILLPDFSRRVVRRVRELKRRRQLYRKALTSAVGCTVVIAAISYLIANHSVSRSSQRAPGTDTHSEWIAAASEPRELPEFDSPSFGQPLAFFFPGSTAVTEVQSAEATYWHSYDPWWNPTGTVGSPG